MDYPVDNLIAVLKACIFLPRPQLENLEDWCRQKLRSADLSWEEIEARLAAVPEPAQVQIFFAAEHHFDSLPYLQGVVRGHPLIPDGHRARTSAVMGVVPEERIVITWSGHIYFLEETGSAGAPALLEERLSGDFVLRLG